MSRQYILDQLRLLSAMQIERPRAIRNQKAAPRISARGLEPCAIQLVARGALSMGVDLGRGLLSRLEYLKYFVLVKDGASVLCGARTVLAECGSFEQGRGQLYLVVSPSNNLDFVRIEFCLLGGAKGLALLLNQVSELLEL